MNFDHRCILKDNRDILTKNIRLDHLNDLLKEYKIFNEFMWKDISSTSDMFDALPFRGPKAFRNIIEILRKAEYNEEADILEMHAVNKKTSDSKLFYKMSSRPLGRCLIINNVKFKPPKDGYYECYRKGSDIDAKSLRSFFESIDFTVTVERNMGSLEMIACLSEFSKCNFMDVDSMIVIILSHGSQSENKDVIYGTDGNCIYKTDIYDIFSNKNCKELQNKPKMFFFNACRGGEKDLGARKSLPNESTDSIGLVMPIFSDIFIVHSTLPNHVSILDIDDGSYFCQALITVLKEHYKTHDLETMITLVNEKLHSNVSLIYRIVQVAHVEYLGRMKKIMLCRSTKS